MTKPVEVQDPYAVSTFVFNLLRKEAIFAFIPLVAFLAMTRAIQESGSLNGNCEQDTLAQLIHALNPPGSKNIWSAQMGTLI